MPLCLSISKPLIMKRSSTTEGVEGEKRAKHGDAQLVRRLGVLKRKLTQETDAELLRQYKQYQDDEEEDPLDPASKERLLRVLHDGRRRKNHVDMVQKELLYKKADITRKNSAMMQELVKMKEGHDRILAQHSDPPLYRLLSHVGRRQLTPSQQMNGYFFISGYAFLSLLQDDHVGGVFAYVRDYEKHSSHLNCVYCDMRLGHAAAGSGFQPVMRDAEGRHAYGICEECMRTVYDDYREDFNEEKGHSGHTCEDIREKMDCVIGAGESLLIAPFHVNDKDGGRRVYPRLFFRRSHRQDVNNPYVNLDGVNIYTYLSIRCFQEDKYYHKYVYPKAVADAEERGTPRCEVHGYEGKVAMI